MTETPSTQSKSDGGVAIGLLAVVVLAAVLRSLGLDFGLPYQYASVDESIVADRAMEFLYSDWNPRYFAYPTLWFYVEALVFEGVARVGAMLGAYESVEAGRLAYYADPTAHFLAGRAVNVVAGLLAVVATFWLGREFARHQPGTSPTQIGLLGALALACNHLHNHITKFIQLDVPLAFLAALAVLLALRYRRRGRRRDLVLCALIGGLGAATKYYGALLCLPLTLAVVSRVAAHGVGGSPVVPILRTLAGCAVLMVGAFLIGAPYVLLDFPKFREDFEFLVMHMEGGHFGQEIPQNGFQVYAQWLWHPWGGVVLCSFAALGLIAWLTRRRMIRASATTTGDPRLSAAQVEGGAGDRIPEDATRARADLTALLILMVFPVVYYVMLARMRIHFTGYLAVILPMLAVLAGCGLSQAARWIGRVLARPRLAVGLVCLPFLHDIGQSASDGLRFARRDTRLLLRDHVIEHVPPSSTIGTDSWLPLPLTEDCLQKMQTQLAAGGDTEKLAAIPLPDRRSPGYLTGRHLEVRLEQARLDRDATRPPRRFDLIQLPPSHMDVDNLAVMRDSGLRYIVISSARYLPLIENPIREQPEFLAERPKYGRWIAFYERLLDGDLVVRRFPAEGEESYGPVLVLCDLDRLP